MRRKVALETGQVYHVFNRSIAKYVIFNNDAEYTNMVDNFKFYQEDVSPSENTPHPKKVSKYYRQLHPNSKLPKYNQDYLVDIVAYCLMPTHFHLILRQLHTGGISTFLGNVQNSYSKFFNTGHRRKGPLWEGRFKNVLVKTDSQLIHLTRYIHLNPTTAHLVQKPEEWPYSSYSEYLKPGERSFCRYSDLIDVNPAHYRDFVHNQIGYQRELSMIRKLVLD